MEEISNAKEYGIPDGHLVGSFGLDKLDDVIKKLSNNTEDIIRIAATGEVLNFKYFEPYHVSGTVNLYENGLLIKLEEYNDQNAKYEDAGKSELYILKDNAVYIVTEVDKRINENYKINQDESRDYKEKLGNVIEIPEELKEATSLSEKIKFFFMSGKRKKQKQLREHYLKIVEEYLNKLINNNIVNK